MKFRDALLCCVLVLPLLSSRAQTPAPPTPNPEPTVIAGIPVNYDEAKVETYTLPDALKLNNGKPVRDAKTWESTRRPEIVEMFETQQYGRDPGRPAGERFEVTETGSAFNGKAIREQVTISFSKDESWPRIHLLIYLRRRSASLCQCFSPSALSRRRMQSTIPRLRRTRFGIRRPTPGFRHQRAGALVALMSSRCWMQDLE